MLQDKEREVRLLFLTEAQEYLDQVESDLLNLGQGEINRSILDNVLRAVHSIKGGGAMMGFLHLSEIAHRIEDFFNILKSGRIKTISSDVGRLFLMSVDEMRQVIAFHVEGSEIKPEWLEIHVNPIFQQLHDHLGDYSIEDNASVISVDAGEDMRAFMFETEVDLCLERLENVLTQPNSPVLREEFLIASQELGCLGEMLDLQLFTSLCASITTLIESMPSPYAKIREIAELSLKQWRRSQALVLIGQFDSMPYQLDFSLDSLDVTTSQIFNSSEKYAIIQSELTSDELDQFLEISSNIDISDSEAIFTDDYETRSIDDYFGIELDEFKSLTETDELDQFEVIDSELPNDLISTSDSKNPLEERFYQPLEPSRELSSSAKTEFRVNSRNEIKTPKNDNTIRIAVRQLDRLSDLSGEFTSERNTLNFQLKQFRNLVDLLRRKVQTLEQSNSRLRDSYDRVNTYVPAVPILLNQTLDRISNISRNSYDGFSDGFDLLEMDRYSELHLLSREIMDNVVQLEEVTSDIEIALSEVEVTEKEFGRTNKQMQAGITQARMQPLSEIVGKFPRVIYELSIQYGKQVELKVRGGNTLIERTILEALNDPLLHLIRNAFDHGIERPETRVAQQKPAIGSIIISANYRGSQTIITVQDDGGGIDIDKVRSKALAVGLSEDDLDIASKQEILELIFEPGFSTAAQVTDLSGRGVGMDVVRSNLRGVGGTVSIDTQSGKGTTFTITLPISQSITKVLLVENNGMLMAFPVSAIEEMLLLSSRQIHSSHSVSLKLESDVSAPRNEDIQAIEWGNFSTPIINLGQYLTFSRSQRYADRTNLPIINEPILLIVASHNKPFAIQCDRYWGEQEIATRLVEGMKMPSGFSGCAILGGKVIPLVDVDKLLESILVPTENNSLTNFETLDSAQNQVQKTIMVVDDSINVRRFLALTLEKSGYRVEQAKDGLEALEKLRINQMIDAIICDVEMPRLDGFGFLAQSQAEAKFKDIPVVMLTSRSGSKHRQLAMNLGATAYFSKPFKEVDLLKTLTQITSNSSQFATIN